MTKTGTEYAQYIASEDWQKRRKVVIADRNHKCERCDLPRWVARLVYDQDLHVHHKNYQNRGNEQPEDLEVLCRRCHDIETFGRSDFREIKIAECSICKEKHFDCYSDRCGRCRVLFPSDPENHPFCFNFEIVGPDGRTFSQHMMDEIDKGIAFMACEALYALIEMVPSVAQHVCGRVAHSVHELYREKAAQL